MGCTDPLANPALQIHALLSPVETPGPHSSLGGGGCHVPRPEMLGDLHPLSGSLKGTAAALRQGPKHPRPRLGLPVGVVEGLLASKIMKLMNAETSPCGLENITTSWLWARQSF